MQRVICALIFSLALTGCSVGSENKDWTGLEAPQTRVYTIEGDQVALSQYQGKTIVFMFWAQWCSRSQQLIRKVNQFAGNMKHRSDVVFIAASVDKAEKIDVVKETIKEARLDNLQHAFSGNEIYDEAYMAFEASNLPYLYVISPDGTVKANGDSIDVLEENVRVR